MNEIHLEEVIQERLFAGLLQTHAEVFFRLSNTLLAERTASWNKKHFFQLYSDADSLESFLDDHDAHLNRTYCFLRELVASIRGFALTGYSVTHLAGRLESYGTPQWMDESDYGRARAAVERVMTFLRTNLVLLLQRMHAEASTLGIEITPETFPEGSFLPVVARRKLPRNVGQAELVEEQQRVAEVAAKYLQACEMLLEIGVRRVEDEDDRARFFETSCTEEQARVYEATVHNLQSTYDTYIRNSRIEAQDARLSHLRGHISASLHLLEAVTQLVHFTERHEKDERDGNTRRQIRELVSRVAVQDIALNELFFWADRFLQSGARVAEALLPTYSEMQELQIELPSDLSLHARPVSLLVAIVNHHGTPVDLEVGGKHCNAASILSVLMAVGSAPDKRHFLFRGDAKPLRDIRLLFENRLGEQGIAGFPRELEYLRRQG